MANEAVIIELLGNKGDPVRYACSDGVAIAKGAILFLDDPRTVSGVVLTDHAVAGIAAAEKVAGDGQLDIACYTNGIFDLYTGGIHLAGDLVKVSGTNYVVQAEHDDVVSGLILGRALETGSDDEVIAVRVML